MEAIDHALRVFQPVLALASATFIAEIRAGLELKGVIAAIAVHDSAPLFNWIMSLAGLQGISDRAAFAFQARHGTPCWHDIEAALTSAPTCPQLQSYWHFASCGYRKTSQSCGRPEHLPKCPLPLLPLRKGVLNEAAFSLAFFFRDVADGDLVSWIDQRLAAADPGIHEPGRDALMRTPLLDPLSHVRGIGHKVWSMLLADLLLAADPGRDRWFATGASMVAIDSLVHAFLHRSGILHRSGAVHAYGPSCYAPNGCADIICAVAGRLDARSVDATFPRVFPRLVQHAVWRFCAEGGWSICNGRQIEDHHSCEQRFCPTFRNCDRLALLPASRA